jgi:hypothetical protein
MLEITGGDTVKLKQTFDAVKISYRRACIKHLFAQGFVSYLF